MSVQELENEISRLPNDDKRKLMVDMFCDCCEEIMEDTNFKEVCIHSLQTKGVDFKDFVSRYG